MDDLIRRKLGVTKTPVLTPEDSDAILNLAAIAFMMQSAQSSRDQHAVILLTKLAKMHFDRVPHLARILKPKVEAFLEFMTKETKRIEDTKL